MPGPRKQPRENLYSTQQVLQATLMARHTLIRYVREGKFPEPEIKANQDGTNSRGSDWYKKSDVDKWIENNSEFIVWRQRKISEDVTLTIPAEDLKLIRSACKELMCDIEPFIIDAAKWKAKTILKQTEMEASYAVNW